MAFDPTCHPQRGAQKFFIQVAVYTACVAWNLLEQDWSDTLPASEGENLDDTRHGCFVNNYSNRWVELAILSTQKSLFHSEFPHLRIVPLISTIKNTFHMLNSFAAALKWNYKFSRILCSVQAIGIKSVRSHIPSLWPGSQRVSGTRSILGLVSLVVSKESESVISNNLFLARHRLTQV